MITKWLKMVVIVVLSFCLVSGLLFGKDLVSYVRSSAKSIRTAVKDAVPIDFELKRARDLVEDIIPEIHANIRLIAQEEVEIAALKTEIENNGEIADEETKRIKSLRESLESQQDSYSFGDKKYTREQVKKDLAERFDRFKEYELVLDSKKRLLTAREKSLDAALKQLDKTKSEKRTLEAKIEGLASQWRLLQASAVGSQLQLDDNKLAQTQKLIDQIKKRLDVAERILTHESLLVQTTPADTITEKDLLTQIDEYFNGGTDSPVK